MVTMAELYYFSPTGGTKKAAELFCAGVAEHTEQIDLCSRGQEPKQPESGLVVLAAPVYGGRIPAIAADKIKRLNGKGKKVVTLAVYGTRAYEDALLELNRTAEESGFEILASAALIARHSIVPAVGEGRPDEADQAEILAFAGKVLEKLGQGEKNPVKVPGNYPYKPEMAVAATPISLSSCTQCQKCVSACPSGAIQMGQGTTVTSLEACILCMACVFACPEQARVLPPPMQGKMEEKLGVLKTVRRENEFFL